MIQHFGRLVVFCALSALMSAASDAHAQTIEVVGADLSDVLMSGDGSTVLYTRARFVGADVYRWQAGTEGLLSTSDGRALSHTLSISHDGSAVLGRAGSRQVVWRNGTTEDVEALTGLNFQALAMSGDSTTLAGSVNDRAFRWSSSTGSQPLGEFFLGGNMNPVPTYATAVNRTGSVLAGIGFAGSTQQIAGFTWTPFDGIELLPQQWFLRPSHISADGSIITGQLFSSEIGPSGIFRWSAATGVTALVGPDFQSQPRIAGMTDDGSIAASATSPHVYLGDSPSPVRIETYLAEHGVDLSGWTVTAVQGVSSNGQIFLLRAFADDQVSILRVVVPAPGATAVIAGGVALVLGSTRRRRMW
jgi:hypothetical protein